jgi:methionine-rich copper-binding protein CopC
MQLPPSRRLAAAVLVAWTVLDALPAAAHAVIIDASPAPYSVMRGGDVPVLLRFNSRIDRRRSRLSLLATDRAPQNLPLDPAAGPDSLAARLEGLTAGQYRLRWQVLGIDGHITRGDIPFEISR